MPTFQSVALVKDGTGEVVKKSASIILLLWPDPIETWIAARKEAVLFYRETRLADEAVIPSN